MGIFLFLLFRLLTFTYRYRYVGLENILEGQEKSGNSNYILAVWHQNLIHTIAAHGDKTYTVMVSKSKDGDILTSVLKRLGHICARGSSRKLNVDKGGKKAKDAMIEILKKGTPAAITIDGPLGPAKKTKLGIIDIAFQAEVAVIPCSSAPQNYWSFKTWDKLRLPKPFSKIIIYYGTPIIICDSKEFSSGREQVDLALEEDSQKALGQLGPNSSGQQ